MSSGVGRLVLRAALAHHVGAHRAVRHLRADVERARHALERVEVLGEALPLPADALGERGARDVLDALHQADQPVVAVGARRREADAAVAHHDRRDAVPRRRREVRVPGHLPVVVGVDVDPARRRRAGRARRSRAGPRPTSPPTAAMRSPSIATSPCARGRPGAVDDGAAADHEIVHVTATTRGARDCPPEMDAGQGRTT